MLQVYLYPQTPPLPEREASSVNGFLNVNDFDIGPRHRQVCKF